MRKYRGAAWTAVLAIGTALVLAACGSSGSSSSSSASGGSATSSSSSGSSSGGTVTLMMGTAPDSLDPGFGYTTQGAEARLARLHRPDDLRARQSGTAGGQLIPGLATALPKITNGGKTYTVTLRKGLVYSNGKPVKASDFACTVERAIKIPWGGSGQFMHGADRGRDRLRERQGQDDLRASRPTTRPARSRST